ncbi:hypothetical protein BSY239_685 [Hydrogenophaga sp. RAC07]|uniref:hypothetical protein n=1 Tax=Hydrogenophaga sp. RAC07 TaxID=1842537 RepID=UPI00083DB09C|nr:hypothetical protein [Hydrogenophaga sp. RAC07]AOF87331.1 hypothetical protein BSY239_685 [Hydrogenophaga sp. RAC07]
MNSDEMIDRLERVERENAVLRDAVIQLRDILSGVMGTADADSAVLTGVLMACGSSPIVQEHVRGALEARMVSNLADNRNQPAFNAFDERMGAVVELLEESAAG